MLRNWNQNQSKSNRKCIGIQMKIYRDNSQSKMPHDKAQREFNRANPMGNEVQEITNGLDSRCKDITAGSVAEKREINFGSWTLREIETTSHSVSLQTSSRSECPYTVGVAAGDDPVVSGGRN